MKIGLKGILDLLIEATYLLIIFLVPLSFSFWIITHNVFELNKIVVFKILFFVLLFLTLTKIVFFSFREHRNRLLTLGAYWLKPFVFILALIFVLLFSTDISQSWWGSYTRQAGLFSYVVYFLWFVVLSFNLLSIKNGNRDNLKKRIQRIVVTAVWSGLLVSIYGVLQILNIDFLSWPEAPHLTHRTFSTLGQPNFLASFLLLIIPLSIYLLCKSQLFLKRFFYLLVVLVQVACLFFTSSRGALVSLVVTALGFVLYLLFKSSLDARKKILFVLVLTSLLLVGLWGTEKALPGRLSNLANHENGSVSARMSFYGAAADAIAKSPIFGYGLENGDNVFIKYYEADWAIQGGVDVTTDRAHNIVLDILVSTGFWGLLFFILLYYSFFVVVRENIREEHSKNLSLALGLGVGAYVFSLLFSFSIVAGEVYFWLFFALLIVLGREQMVSLKPVKGKVISKIFIIIILFVFSTVMIGKQASVLRADYYFSELYYGLAKRDYSTALVLYNYINEEKIPEPQQRFYDYFLGDKLSDFYGSIDELALQKIADNKLGIVLESLPDKSYKDFLVKAKINSVLGNYDLSEDYFAKLNSYSPNWPKGYLELARMLSAKGDIIPAIASYHLVEINLPNTENKFLDGEQKEFALYYRYVIYKEIATVYESVGDYMNAGKYYQRAYSSYPSDFLLLKNIADSYYLQGDLEKAIEYNLHGFTRSPQDYNWAVALSVLYKDQGNLEKGRMFLEKAIELASEEEWLGE